MRVLNKPWLQFLFMGIALFLLNQWAFPPPKPVLGPPSPERLAAMAQNYAQFAQGKVGPEVLARFIETELRDELLFREAIARDLHYRDMAVEQRIIRNMRFLDAQSQATDAALIEQGYALRLHLTDEVIRRRLVQIMERLIVATRPGLPPTAEQVASRYERDLAAWQASERYSFSHVFLSLERSDEMDTLIREIERRQLSPAEARLLGAPFLSGFEFSRQTPDQITRVFGAVFTEQLRASGAEAGQWIGPFASVFGQHYLFLSEFEASRTQRLEEVSDSIKRDLVREAEAQAIADWVDQAMARYEVRRS
jgi:hypothetical protein